MKKTKATNLPVPDEVISHINSWSLDRKISKVNNISLPIFEQNKRLIPDDELDYDDDVVYQSNRKRINSALDSELDENYDIPDKTYFDPDPILLDAIQEDTVDVIEDVSDKVNDEVDPNSVMYDDTEIDDGLLYGNEVDISDDIIIQDSEITEIDELPEIEQPQLRRSPRNHQTGRWQSNRSNKAVGCCIPYNLSYTDNTYAFNMTESEGIGKLGDIAVESIKKEMKQMCEKEVWEGVLINSLNPLQKKSIITSGMFLKDKYTADGKFDKLKSRLVAGGHLQDRSIYNDGSSPTVSTTSIFTITAIAASENRSVATIDFPGAFLNSDMPSEGDHTVYMRLNKYLTNVLISIDKSYIKYVNDKGTCIVKLKKALYGCVESAKLWYDKISNDLSKLGFTANSYYMCVFNKIEKNTTCYDALFL